MNSINPIESGDEAFYIGTAKVEPKLRLVTLSGEEPQAISARQMSALLVLASNFGQMISRAKMHEVLCLSKEGHRDKAAISHHIGHLRKVLGDSSKDSQFIKTVRGGGYCLLKEPQLEPPATWTSSPYRGLKPFEFEHAPIFFGRRKQVAALHSKVEMRRQSGSSFLLVSGPSGAGKSSIVKAGLLPKIAKELPHSQSFAHAIFHFKGGQGALFVDFANSLIEALPWLLERLGDADSVAACAIRNPNKISEQLDLVKQDTRLVIVVDQLDELMAAHTVSSLELNQFFTLLLSIASNPNCDLIATVRMDFLTRCLNNAVIGPELVDQGLYILQPPSLADMREIIEAPAHLKGIRFETNAQEENLVDLIIQDLYPHLDAMPIVAYALEMLYETAKDNIITFAQYEQIGGIRGCLARRCEAEYQGLDKREQRSLGGVLARLTLIDPNAPGNVVAHTAVWSDLAVDKASEKLLQRFLSARILSVTRNGKGEKSIRLAHEAVLSEWSRAREWLTQNTELVIIDSKLASEAESWLSADRDSSMLLPSGLKLAEAQRLRNGDLTFSSSVKEFIDESLEQEERAQTRKRLIRFSIAASAAVFAVLSIITSFLGVRYWQQLQTANALRAESEQALQRAVVEREIAVSASELMINTFSFDTPGNKNNSVVSAQELLDKKYKNIIGDESLTDQLRAAQLSVIGRAYLELGNSDIAIGILEHALRLQRSTAQGDQILIAQTLTSLARSITTHDNQIARGKQLLSESIEIYKSAPNSGRELANAYGEFARLLKYELNFASAEQYYKDALQALNASTLSDAKLHRHLSLRLAYMQTLQLKLQEAGALSAKILEQDKKLLEPDDLELSKTHSQYGFWLYYQRRFAESVVHYEEALRIVKANYPHDHRTVSQAEGALGHRLVQAGNYDRAIEVLNRAIESEATLYGDNTTQLGVYRVSLADALLRLGRAEEAKALALEIKRIIRSKGGRPVGSLEILSNSLLGAALSQLGECRRGLELMELGYEGALASFGSNSPYTFEVETRLERNAKKGC